MTVAQVQGDAMAVMGYMEEFYFESEMCIRDRKYKDGRVTCCEYEGRSPQGERG